MSKTALKFDMFNRLCKPLLSHSFFLFGPRGSGKTSLLRQILPPSEKVLWFNFLDDTLYQELLSKPHLFVERIPTSFNKTSWVVADEIQRLPNLLNYVHLLIEERKIKFALTGSSSRKLKRGGANLLAGRAFLNQMHPLTHIEIGDQFDLTLMLQWGALPKIFSLESALEKREFLRSYCGAYLREEIKEEQLVRNLDPFARFLDSAAQQNGKIINASKIARDAMTESKSVQRYFDILVETFLGFYLAPYHRSVRKVQTAKSKFYFFDLGVKRALDGTLSSDLTESTYAYGEAFEHFLILEFFKLRDYLRTEDKFYYICSKDNVEIDLLIERGRSELWAVEIKSSKKVDEVELHKKINLAKDLKVKKFLVASRENQSRVVRTQGITVEIDPWQISLSKVFNRLLS